MMSFTRAESPHVTVHIEDRHPQMTPFRKGITLCAGCLVTGLLGGIPGSFASADTGEPPQAISIGDPVDQVRRVLGGVNTPLIPANNATPGSQALLLPDRGMIVFFDGASKIYRIRLNAPFAATVCGTHIGDARQAVMDRAGPPSQILPNQVFPERTSYIYKCNSSLYVRYDFGTDNRLVSMFVLAGSIPAPPPVPLSEHNSMLTTLQAAAPQTGDPRVTEGHQHFATALRAQGQLAPAHDIGCIAIEAVTPQYTGADLYSATRKCLDKDQYEMAAPLFSIAGAYARFDAARITDPTVSGGISVLIINVGNELTADQKVGFLAAVTSLHDDARKHTKFCAQVRRIGPPDYIPTYLTSHGTGAQDGRQSDQNGLARNFDRKGSWSQLLSDGLRCQGG